MSVQVREESQRSRPVPLLTQHALKTVPCNRKVVLWIINPLPANVENTVSSE